MYGQGTCFILKPVYAIMLSSFSFERLWFQMSILPTTNNGQRTTFEGFYAASLRSRQEVLKDVQVTFHGHTLNLLTLKIWRIWRNKRQIKIANFLRDLYLFLIE